MKYSIKEDNRPGFYFFCNDWMSDTGLQSCSLAAKGLWIEMINLMWVSPKRGYLLLQNANKPDIKQLAHLVRSTVVQVEELLVELCQNMVYSTDENGVIYCRKILKMEHIRQVRSEAGMQGMSKRYKVCYNKNLTGSKTAYLTNGQHLSHSDSRKDSRILKKKKDEFEVVWKLYPRKLGKEEAFKFFCSQVVTEEDNNNILKALENFKKDINLKGTEEKFIPHGSTWFNKVWRDWIEYQALVKPAKDPKNILV